MILDTGKFWFRVVESGGEQQLFKTSGPEHLTSPPLSSDWQLVDFRVAFTKEEQIQLAQIDAFFGTNFSQMESSSSSPKLLRLKNYLYRSVLIDSQMVLQRTTVPQEEEPSGKNFKGSHVLVYENFKVTGKSVIWQNLDEIPSLGLDQDDIQKLETHFKLKI